MIIKQRNDMFLKQRLIFVAISVVFVITGCVLSNYYRKKKFLSYPRIFNEIAVNSSVSEITEYIGYTRGYYLLELTNKKIYVIDYELESELKVGSNIIKCQGDNRVKIIANGNYKYFEFIRKY